MATDNQLHARHSPTHIDLIGELADDEYDGDRPDAERKVVEEGLKALGYIERPNEGIALYLWYLRRIGLVLGFVGLIFVGYGVFGPRLHSIVGFSLLLVGFLFVALEEGLRLHHRRGADRTDEALSEPVRAR